MWRAPQWTWSRCGPRDAQGRKGPDRGRELLDRTDQPCKRWGGSESLTLGLEGRDGRAHRRVTALLSAQRGQSMGGPPVVWPVLLCDEGHADG